MADETKKSAPPSPEEEGAFDTIVLNRSVWHKPVQFLGMIALMASAIPLWLFAFDGDLSTPWKKWTVLGAFAFGAALVLVYLFATKIQATYRITDNHCVAETGFVARNICEVEIDHIRNINVRQTVLQRLFGIGNVEISSAGTEKVEVVFESVKDPVSVSREIKRRDAAIEKVQRGTPAAAKSNDD
jgi:uncharacterized membrane protein YdbT with pleckstrin-like domain